MQNVNADSRNTEKPMESARNREVGIVTTDYRMNADRGDRTALIPALRAATLSPRRSVVGGGS